MKKIAETRITNSSLTTVPKAVKLFLNAEAGDVVGWYVDNDHRITIKKERQ
ncbi:MAG: hypothetical protein KAW39_03070 [Thermoplasmata archaeon]|nr:hypothetical protein [Thermoplasmata archaeon]